MSCFSYPPISPKSPSVKGRILEFATRENTPFIVQTILINEQTAAETVENFILTADADGRKRHRPPAARAVATGANAVSSAAQRRGNVSTLLPPPSHGGVRCAHAGGRSRSVSDDALPPPPRLVGGTSHVARRLPLTRVPCEIVSSRKEVSVHHFISIPLQRGRHLMAGFSDRAPWMRGLQLSEK